MWIFDYIDYSVSPRTKILICLLISVALWVVYMWDPERRRKKVDLSENSVMNYIEVDPEKLQASAKVLRPKKEKKSMTAQSTTLEHLDEYVKELKRLRINNIDDV